MISTRAIEDKKRVLTKKPKMSVLNQAPTNPSTVFFGDKANSCVRPRVIPRKGWSRRTQESEIESRTETVISGFSPERTYVPDCIEIDDDVPQT